MRANRADKAYLLLRLSLPVAHYFTRNKRSCRLCYRPKNNDIALIGATERTVA